MKVGRRGTQGVCVRGCQRRWIRGPGALDHNHVESFVFAGEARRTVWLGSDGPRTGDAVVVSGVCVASGAGLTPLVARIARSAGLGRGLATGAGLTLSFSIRRFPRRARLVRKWPASR